MKTSLFQCWAAPPAHKLSYTGVWEESPYIIENTFADRSAIDVIDHVQVIVFWMKLINQDQIQLFFLLEQSCM